MLSTTAAQVKSDSNELQGTTLDLHQSKKGGSGS